MRDCKEIRAFLVAVEDARDDPAAIGASHIGDLPERLQSGLKTAIKAIVDARYERVALREAAELVSSARKYPGGLGEAIQVLTRALIDNDAFDMRR